MNQPGRHPRKELDPTLLQVLTDNGGPARRRPVLQSQKESTPPYGYGPAQRPVHSMAEAGVATKSVRKDNSGTPMVSLIRWNWTDPTSSTTPEP